MKILGRKFLEIELLRIGIALLLILLAVLLEHHLRQFNPRMSILGFYAIVMVSLLLAHEVGTLVLSALCLQYFILSSHTFSLALPNDLIIQLVLLFSNLLILELFRRNKSKIDSLEVELKNELNHRYLFTLGVSRLMKQPVHLTKMGALFLKGSNPESDKFKKALELLVMKSEEVEHILKDLLNVSLLATAEPLDLIVTDHSLRTLVQESVSTFNVKHPGKILFESKSDGRPGKWNAEGMKRTVEALCANGIKFGNEKPVSVKFSENDSHASIVITNFGNPLTDVQKTDIFKPFLNLFGKNKNEYTGTGFNLTLVKGIVEAHGGNIKVVSNALEGTSFQVLLPVRK